MFITIEGLDGSGKTTQFKMLTDYLKNRGYPVLTTREPGGTVIGDQIRDIVHNLKHTEMHPHTEVLLYIASRAQLVAQIIQPHLQTGGMVLSDRYADSTLAYQGYGHGLDIATLQMILNFATGGLKPDVTIYLDISAEDGLLRRQKAAHGGEEWNRLDAYKLEFHQRVHRGYLQLIAAEPARWLVVPAQGEVGKVHQQICTLLAPHLP